jgi:DNA polymerase III delta prime subunit
MENTIPWVEKYRPNSFDNIVLGPINQSIFNNVLQTNYFPNMLFYGPPGTGKTTTIINLIDSYYKQNNIKNYKSSIIHLNASDERGIDTIRNQIIQFVNSNGMYINNLKFVVLDEVDYMTKNAQQALKYLLQHNHKNIRFCLICNYISKIEESLKNEFICIRFNQLPEDKIVHFLRNIIDKENIHLEDKDIYKLLSKFSSDIRSMINYLQLNQSNNIEDVNILQKTIYEDINTFFINNKDYITNVEYLHNVSIKYNTNKIEIIKDYLNYIIENHPKYICSELLNNVEKIMHINTSIEHMLLFFNFNILKFIT